MNKTKVIATIGPASKSLECIEELINHGMDIARINMSYASYDECEKIIKNIRLANERTNKNIAIMLDLIGPNLRVGKLVNASAYLKNGDKIKIYIDELIGDNTKFSVNYKGLLEDVNYGTIIKLSNGFVDLEVVDICSDYLLCRVLNDGFIYENTSINIPSIRLNMPFISSKDRSDIKFAHDNEVDFIAVSFVQNSENILDINDLLIELKDDHMAILAKIETELAVDDIDRIIKSSDGIIVARGDLGVEVPLERVPSIQKSIIRKSHLAGKVSFVTTELLSSMENLIKPTRSEVSDVANAVLDGVDGVILTNETADGKYPIESIKMMEKIIESAEMDIDYLELTDKAMRTEKQDVTGLVAYNVTQTANRLKAKAIIVPTMSGYTAIKVSRFRPTCPIIAVSPNIDTVKSLALYFGVMPILIDELNSFDKIIEKSKKLTKEVIKIEPGDKIILTGGYPFNKIKHTNFMEIEEL